MTSWRYLAPVAAVAVLGAVVLCVVANREDTTIGLFTKAIDQLASRRHAPWPPTEPDSKTARPAP